MPEIKLPPPSKDLEDFMRMTASQVSLKPMLDDHARAAVELNRAEPVLERPAKVGNAVFSFNVPWRSVVQAAMDAYATPDRAAAVVPEGWKLVPVEPTPEMMQAGFDVPGSFAYGLTYRAMLAAAPSQPAAQSEDVPRWTKEQIDYINAQADELYNKIHGKPAAQDGAEDHRHHFVRDSDHPNHECCQTCGAVKKDGVLQASQPVAQQEPVQGIAANVVTSCANWLESRADTYWALKYGHSELMRTYADELRKITTLPAQQDDARDAARYRWLRRYDTGDNIIVMLNDERCLVGKELDAAIDAAMAQGEKQ